MKQKANLIWIYFLKITVLNCEKSHCKNFEILPATLINQKFTSRPGGIIKSKNRKRERQIDQSSSRLVRECAIPARYISWFEKLSVAFVLQPSRNVS
ncbi:hypothetical protein PUN28_013216 [Cardiocondyla obscurior]|uniref:Secreted protein n=1 Tax=Cardiocondyla obscurior TaxID=286306 RepID=A0AAW2F7K2_9HYME